MEDIPKEVFDSGVWIDRLIIAVIASIIAGFMRDWITRLFAKYSEWYRQRKAAKLAWQKKYFELLVSDQAVLTAHSFQAKNLLDQFMMMFAVLLFLKIFSGLSIVGRFPYARADTTVEDIFTYMLFALVGLFAMSSGYLATSRIAIATRAYSALVDRRMKQIREVQDGVRLQ